MLPDLCALIVDDEQDIRELIGMALERIDIKCEQAANVTEAMALLESGNFHFCITDMKLPDGDGIQLIHHCNRNYPDMPVAMITAFGNMEVGVNALKAGAFDVVAKPLDIQQLRNLATAALRLSKVTGTLPEQCTNLIIGDSSPMQELRTTLRKVGRTQAPVFIQGEYGTGKEGIARAIHLMSSRSSHPFITINCDALQDENAAETLFGFRDDHGIVHDGLIQNAHQGTLFLNNIEHLGLEFQAQLLQLLTDKKIRALHDTHEHDLDIRIISASSADLPALASSGHFRQDLLFRIRVVHLSVPPLRTHREDIPQLTTHLLQTYASQWDMPEVSVSDEALRAICEYDFPGNTRELDAILQRAFTLMEGEEIQLSDLSFEPETPQGGYHSNNEAVGDLEGYLERLEREAIEEALNATRWNKTAAAERLGISFRALRYRLKKLAID